jgi:hypothetical protein
MGPERIAAGPVDITTTQVGDDEVTNMAHGEYALHIFVNKAAGMFGVEESGNTEE